MNKVEKIMPNRLVARCLIIFLFALTLAPPSYAEDNPPKPYEWTKIQDLKPNASATNRPVKQKWAVVIGASKFKEKRLNGDEQSMDAAAKQFYDYLLDDRGGRFAANHAKLLLNS